MRFHTGDMSSIPVWPFAGNLVCYRSPASLHSRSLGLNQLRSKSENSPSIQFNPLLDRSRMQFEQVVVKVVEVQR